MSVIKLSGFGGMLPSWESRLLPEGQADYARDAWLISGALTGWRQPKLLRALNNSAAKFVYRIPNKVTNNTAILANDSKWLEFLDPDTTVMRSPVVQDQYDRHYVASPSGQPIYNTYDRILADEPWWLLGVPASGCTPGVTIEGGGGTAQLGFPNVDANTGGTGVYVPGNQITLVPITPNGDMLLQDIGFQPTLTTSINFFGVVYSDLNGKPDQLIGVSDQSVADLSGTAASATFTNAVALGLNVPYWIGIHTDQPYNATAVNDANRGASYAATFTNGPPEFLNAAGVATDAPTLQIWADLVSTAVFTARAYVYTWVTAYGEEGPPSPPSVVNGWANGTWRIELFTPDPLDMGVRRNITKTRIYRSISNVSGQGTYFFVAEIPVTQAEYLDTADDATIALNLQLASLYWFEPPSDLQGILPVPNGIAVGWRSNEVWFSEAYRPHAWPPGYVLTTEFPIVGVGVCGQAIVVATQGTPYLINGVSPAAMALTKINLTEPCLHRGSIVATDTTVLYVSQNGLIQVSQSGQGSNVTEGWISRERWQELTPIRLVRAVKHATTYFAFGTTINEPPIRDGFTVELSPQDQVSFTIWPQAGGHRLGFCQLSSPNNLDIDNVELDPWTGIALLVQGGAVYQYDFTDQAPVIVPYKWRSKTYQQQSAKNFSAMKVWFDVPPGTPPQMDRNVLEPQPTLGPNQYGIVRVYADGQLYQTRELRRSGELLRIHSGIKAESWAFEVEGRVTVSNLQVATSAKELGLV